MTTEQLTERLIKHEERIACVEASTKSAHKRIDENDQITNGIHKLASNMEALTLQVKLLAESMDSSVARIENSLKRQGERIGKLEKEPGNKWKAATAQIVSLAIAAVIGGIIANIVRIGGV